MRLRRSGLTIYTISALAALISTSAAAHQRIDITRISLEELVNIDVVSASKIKDEYLRTSSAIYVLTAEDIRLSGVRTLPDALRLVPGVHVASIDGNKWAVGIRGFASRSTNNIQVLIDGRSVYDPLFSGVFWEAKDVMLDNVERIEVIRGPGSTQWGVNAVNGVINIITKSALETQGSYIETGAGTQEMRFIDARQGWRDEAGVATRVYAKYVDKDRSDPTPRSQDEYHMARAGLRHDHPLAGGDQLSIKANIYRGTANENSPVSRFDVNHRGYNVLTRWDDDGNGQSPGRWLQFYYDWFEVDHWAIGEKRGTYALEYQERHPLGKGRHTINWGAEYRYTRDEIRGTALLDVTFPKRSDEIYSLHAVDEVWLVPEHHKLDVGAKLEHNDYTGLEVQPSVRYAWYPNQSHTWWASVARATRTPSRLEADAIILGTPISQQLDAEVLTAYEIGYRLLPSTEIFLDSTVFYNDYSRLAPLDGGIIPNPIRGKSQGFELALRTTPSVHWRLDFSYSYLDLNLKRRADGSLPARIRLTEGSAPRHLISMHAGWQASANLDTDIIVRYADKLPAQGIPAYTAVDLRIGWHFLPDIELVVMGRNLFTGHHYEQRSSSAVEVSPSTYASITFHM